MSIIPNQELDCSGLACPMPIIKTRKTIDGMQVGQVLKMTATDPGSIPDVEAWAKKTGHEVLSAEQAGSQFIFYIKKAK
jgi:tRNA 2-thiouridine synthesizing protein A